jgi:HME family heavy-metal exporter
MGRIVADIRKAIAATALPSGSFINLEGQFQAQEQATGQIVGLSLVSLALMFLVLYSRYRSAVLAGIIMANIPLALIGSVVAMWLAGVTLSVATMVGFITLAGIATRNGILKISHYINLCRFEGETFSQAMIVRGSIERLTPVLMTALVAAFAIRGGVTLDLFLGPVFNFHTGFSFEKREMALAQSRLNNHTTNLSLMRSMLCVHSDMLHMMI